MLKRQAQRESVIGRFGVSPQSTLREVIARIDAGGEGVALVLDPDETLRGIITDGDIRRAVLDGVDLDGSIAVLLDKKASRSQATPVTATVGASAEHLRLMMMERGLRHVPVIDETGRLQDLALASTLMAGSAPLLQAVVMAGGKGSRLYPITRDTPKSLLKVGNFPMMERIIRQLREIGIQRVNIATHHMADKIVDHLGDGSALGIELHYTREPAPLGTAGALAMLEETADTLLVINSDILTDLDFRALSQYHHDNRADLTVAVRKYEVNVPYGVVESKGHVVERLVEKPCLSFFINAGIYLLEPAMLNLIGKGERLDMTELIQRAIDGGRHVITFPIHEYWLDIGRFEDLEQAKRDAASGKVFE